MTTVTFDAHKDFFSVPARNRSARLLASPRLPRPQGAVVDDRGCLDWSWYKEGAKRAAPFLQKVPADLCFEFAELVEPEQIRRFAARWGPLGLEQRFERVEDWRRYARLARAILRMVGAELMGDKGSDDDWATLNAWVIPGRPPLPRAHPTVRIRVTIGAVNAWYSKARGHAILDVVGMQPQIRPGNISSLFGILITQIAYTIARSDEMAVCAGCKAPFTPQQRPSRGSRQYCRKCRKAKVPQRDASRDWRRRNRSGQTA